MLIFTPNISPLPQEESEQENGYGDSDYEAPEVSAHRATASSEDEVPLASRKRKSVPTKTKKRQDSSEEEKVPKVGNCFFSLKK